MLCIDESIIPFRERIIFRRYMKQKKHKYGIKIFKLCCDDNCTYNFRIYTGKSLEKENTTPTNVVINLCENVEMWIKTILYSRTIITRVRIKRTNSYPKIRIWLVLFDQIAKTIQMKL